MVLPDNILDPNGKDEETSEQGPSSKIVYINSCDELLTSFAEILEELQKAGGCYNPKKFLNKLVMQHPQFDGGDQHDSHELLRQLLDSVM